MNHITKFIDNIKQTKIAPNKNLLTTYKYAAFFAGDLLNILLFLIVLAGFRYSRIIIASIPETETLGFEITYSILAIISAIVYYASFVALFCLLCNTYSVLVAGINKYIKLTVTGISGVLSIVYYFVFKSGLVEFVNTLEHISVLNINLRFIIKNMFINQSIVEYVNSSASFIMFCIFLILTFSTAISFFITLEEKFSIKKDAEE